MSDDSERYFEIEEPEERERAKGEEHPDRPEAPSENAPDETQSSDRHSTSGRELEPLGSTRWFWAPLLLFIFGSSFVYLTHQSVGYAWDEAYYYEPAKAAAEWVVKVFTGDFPFTREKIDLHWEPLHEHPSIQKLVSGFSILLFEDKMGPIDAIRLPMAGLFGASLVLLFLIGRLAWGNAAGLMAALAYFAMPRVFGHAHFASIETPLLFGTLLTIYCFIRGLDSRRWSILTGLALGLLLATKINGLFLIPAFLLWGHLFARRRYVNNLFCILIISPIAFVLFWPWLWYDTFGRLVDYIQFFIGHQKTEVWFMGRRWGFGDPPTSPAPWFYPTVMIGVTLPITLLLFLVLGLVRAAAGFRKHPLPILFVLIGFVFWAAASMPATPKYDGVRLFLPLFPMVALLIGGAGHYAAGFLERMGQGKGKVPRSHLATGAICVLLSLEGIVGSIRYHPYYLSYFNPIVGGLKGAESKGFEVTYWGETVNQDVLETINQVMPPGGNLYVFTLHAKCFYHLQNWGLLRRDLIINGPMPPRGYDAHLIQIRKGFFKSQEWALVEDSPLRPPSVRPIAEWSHMGVRLLALYRTGADYELYRMKLKEQAQAADP